MSSHDIVPPRVTLGFRPSRKKTLPSETGIDPYKWQGRLPPVSGRVFGHYDHGDSSIVAPVLCATSARANFELVAPVKNNHGSTIDIESREFRGCAHVL